MTEAQQLKAPTPLQALSVTYQVLRGTEEKVLKKNTPKKDFPRTRVLKRVADACSFDQFINFAETGRLPEGADPVDLKPEEMDLVKGGLILDNIGSQGPTTSYVTGSVEYLSMVHLPMGCGLASAAGDLAGAALELTCSILSVNTNGFNQESGTLGAGSAGVDGGPGIGFERIRFEY